MKSPETHSGKTVLMLPSSHQLALDLAFPDDMRLESFYRTAQNRPVLAALDELGDERRGLDSLYLWGPMAAGKTHLLVAMARHMPLERWTPYLDLLEISTQAQQGEPVEWLSGLESASLVCLDHMDAVVGDKAWEEALFHLFNRMQAVGGRLLMAGRQSPMQMAWALPDWGSRAAWGLVLALMPLDDMECLDALQQRAQLKGLELPREVGEYLLQRYPRDMQSLTRLLDHLDRAALAAARRLTIPFVKSVLRL